jgi:putative lipoprotein
MRKMVLSLLPFAALALAGCNSSSSSPSSDGSSASSGSAAATKVANEVSGTVDLHAAAGQALSPKAILAINLVDVSSTADAGAPPLASKTTPATQFPQPFTLTFDPSKVKADDLYVVQAVVTDGDRHYTINIQAPVLTKANKNDGIAIDLLAEQTPGEKALAAFTAEQKQLGAMKVKSGTKLEADVSRSWQVFRQDNDVKFIRELVDYSAKGFTSTDYAYKNGKPWVVVQQTKPNQGAKPSAIDRAGWDDNGNLVLKQHEVNGNVQVLDDATAASLQKQGGAILTLATGGKDK